MYHVSLIPGITYLYFLLGWNPTLSSFYSTFHLQKNEISVQGAPSPLACFLSWNPSLSISLTIID